MNSRLMVGEDEKEDNQPTNQITIFEKNTWNEKKREWERGIYNKLRYKNELIDLDIWLNEN